MTESGSPEIHDRVASDNAAEPTMPGVVHILWTGGWDSTFRVADLVCTYRAEVVPHYVTSGRRSQRIEIETIDNLSTLIRAIGDGNLHDLVIHETTDRHPPDQFNRRFNELRSIEVLGSQYEWIARVAAGIGSEVELGFLGIDFTTENILKGHLVFEPDAAPTPTYRLEPHPPLDAYELFRNFSFPLFGMTKLDIQNEAEAKGFRHVLEHTWFCHKPTKDRAPCGMCPPCRTTRREGLGRRVPAVRFRRAATAVRNPIARMVRAARRT